MGGRGVNEHDKQQVRQILKRSFPPVHTELGRDLWPAVLGKLDPCPIPVPWYDWALIVVSAGVLLFFPQLLLVFAYHL